LLLAKRKFMKFRNFFKIFLKGCQIKQKNLEKAFQKEENSGRRNRPKVDSHRKIPENRARV
jgi:hypothetical protein